MIKKLLAICIIFFALYSANAQNQFENPGFENWENVGLPVEEPVDWSSIKTGDVTILNNAAPVVWGKSTDAHSGNYSIHLFNVYVALIGQSAVGTISNGRYHPDLNHDNSWTYLDTLNSQWNTPIAARPDSVVGWFKCSPQPGDHGQVKVTVHKGYGQHPEGEYGYIGVALFQLPGDTVSEWTRFSAPFSYISDEMPDNLLCVLMSGDGWSAIGTSSALYDDLQLIYNTPGINDLNADNLRVYSGDGEIIVYLNESSRLNYKLNVIDITGKIVFSGEFTGGETKRINLGLTSGMYIVNASSEGKNISKKVMINSVRN